MTALKSDGATPRFVGGCVRNALLDASPTDLDIAIDVEPAETMRLLEAASLKAIPTGIQHGTITTVVDNDGVQETIEITSLRRDVETDGRRAVVAFTNDWAEDAQRRDFTINSLYADEQGRVYDPLGDGMSDIAACRVRFIGDAKLRIQEDRLRILRYYRFIAWYGQASLDVNDLAATRALRDGLNELARERVGAELKKLLSASSPAFSVRLMTEAKILALSLPGAVSDASTRLRALEVVEGMLKLKPSWPRRLIAIVSADDAAHKLEDSLRLSRAESAHLKRLRKAMVMDAGEAAYRFGADIAHDALALRLSKEHNVSETERREALVTIANGAEAQFPLTAKDLIDAGLAPGPAIGATLKAAEENWIRHNFALDRKTLLDLALEK